MIYYNTKSHVMKKESMKENTKQNKA